MDATVEAAAPDAPAATAGYETTPDPAASPHPAAGRTAPPTRRERRHPLTAQAAPAAAVGCLVLAAAAVQAAKGLSAADQPIAVWTAATAVVVAVVAAMVCHVRLDDPKTRARAFAFCATAASWMSVVAFGGLSLNAVAVLAALGAALSLHWWRKRRIPNTGHKTTPAPQRVEVPDATRYMRRWDKYLGGQGGLLPGSKLESPEQIKAGWRYVLRLVPGKQSIATLMGVIALVRGGLGLTVAQDVIAEKHPVLAEPAVLLTVVTKSPVAQAHEWPGPDAFSDGMVSLGPYVDGEGVARWTVYTVDRMKGGFIQGGSGAGKSRTIESIVMSVAASESHPTVVWFGDGQGNASSPMLMKHADYSARTHDQIVEMFATAMLVMELRQDENGLEEEIGFKPDADRPGLLIVLDECHKPLSKIENPEKWLALQYMISTMAREGQKVGVVPLLATQEPTLGAFGGAGNFSEQVRSNLLMGNGIMMRGKDPNARTVFRVQDDPSQFPELPGYALMVAGDSGGRTAPFRSYYLTDEQRAYWPQRITWRELDLGSANAAGLPYIMRRELAEKAREETRRRVAARRQGHNLAGQVDMVFAAAAAAAGGDGAEQGVPPVAQFPVWNPDAVAVEKPAREMHAGHRRVLDAIAAGHTSPKAIQEATGYSERQVHNHLKDLRDEFGQIVGGQDTGSHGRYTLAPKVVS